jgi:predicted nuclease with TOPRIM domain
MPSDEQINERIEQLERERETLREDEAHRPADADQDAGRLEEIRVELDRLWDLLRQRRALREAGQDPDAAQERDAGTVENYWQ